MGAEAKKQIIKDFHTNSGRQFEIKCFEWLSFLFTDLRDAVALGEVDREGVDLFSLNQTGKYQQVYQCKGFEKAFAKRQFDQCVKSIKSFIKAGCPTEKYFFVVNNIINSEYHKKLEEEVVQVKAIGLADSATLLTVHSFIEYYDLEFQTFIMRKIIESNQKYLNAFTSVMQQTFYMRDVPFVVSNSEDITPINFLWNECKSGIYNKSTVSKLSSKHFLIVSDFGFGKTSLLLQFYLLLLKQKYIPIFLPVSSFRTNSFSNTSNISKEVFRTITQLDLEVNDKILKFSAESMNNLFKTNPKIIVMFDGLDEHRDLYHHESLKTLLESSIEWASPTIFSLRKSFRDERNAEFEVPINRKYRRNNIQRELYLLEWDSRTINTNYKI